MAFLVQPSGARPSLGRVLLALMVLSVPGCLVLEQFGWRDIGPTFSHVTHVEGEELECIDCHLGYEDEDDVGYPRLKACMLCHEDFDEEAAPEARAAAFYQDGKYLVTRANDLDLEIKFSHLAHVTDEQGCMACHQNIVETDEVRPWMGMSMQECMDCHAELGQPNECDSCHEEIRVDVEPASHEGAWDRFHGLALRNASEQTADRCDICHEPSSCVMCHQSEMPANHNNFWRRRAHGLTARMDRENCAACHGVDYCDRCHTTAEPLSHNGMWGGSRNTHCYGCHLAGGSGGGGVEGGQSCSLCHLAGEPSHALAPPQPPGHNPASDCRECHTILTHVDNGDNCTACHK